MAMPGVRALLLALILAAPVAAQPGRQEALRLIATGPGALEVRWRQLLRPVNGTAAAGGQP